MKADIESRDDLRIILSEFYNYLLQSEELSHFFQAFKDKELLEQHLDTLVDFWDNTLFYSGTYNKNAIKPHLKIHQEKGLSTSDFNDWLRYFNRAVDHCFEGVNADNMKSRALSIATVMKIKMNLV